MTSYGQGKSWVKRKFQKKNYVGVRVSSTSSEIYNIAIFFV
jgi:hypothetical protein